MARINIEDSLFKDQRFFKLLIKTGCQYKSLGLLTSAWVLAQDNWIKYKGIPKKAWPKDLDILIEVEFAEELDNDCIYVKGSEFAFAWLDQKSKAGKSTSKEKLNKLAEARAKRAKMSERTLNGSERTLNGSEALSLSLSLKKEEYIYENLENSENNEKEIIFDQMQKEEAEKEQQKLKFNNSATNKFNELFSKDNGNWVRCLDEYGLEKRLKRHLGAIKETFDTQQAFEDFVEAKAQSAKCLDILQKHGGDKEKARYQINEYVITCVKREIGAIA